MADIMRGAARTKMLGVIAAVLWVTGAFGGLPHVEAATTSYVVNTSADGPASPSDCSGTNPCTLRDAVTKATAGTGDFSITFAAPYHITLTAGQLTLGQTSGPNTITIIGNGQGNTILDAAGQSRVFDNETNTSLQNLTIENGLAAGPGVSGRGGGIYDNGVLAITSVTLSHNATAAAGAPTNEQGGAIFKNSTRALTISDSTITGNTASKGGGIFAITGTLILSRDTFTNNVARGNTSPALAAQGGAILTAGRSTAIYNSVFKNNHAHTAAPSCSGDPTTQGNGGAIYAFGVTSVIGGSISGNTADCLGGGAFSVPLLSLQGTSITQNTAGSAGGGVYGQNSLSLTNDSVQHNTAGAAHASVGMGGGVFAGGPTSIYGGLIAFNRTLGGTSGNPSNGGGIYDAYDTTLTGAHIIDNSADNGAGVYQATASVVMENSLVSLNRASHDGGGIYQATGEPSLLLAKTNVTGNIAGHTAGGLFNPSYQSTMQVDGSLVRGNVAPACANTVRPCPPSSTAPAPIVLTVNSTADGAPNPANCPGPGCRLRDAVARASSTGYAAGTTFTITLQPREYDLPLGTLTLTHNIIQLQGQGSGSTTVKNTNGSGSVFDVETNSVLSGMTITGGHATQGGGVYDNGLLAILTSDIIGNTASSQGGGIFKTSVSHTNPLFIRGTTIDGNMTTGFGGGGIYTSGTLDATELVGTILKNNTSIGYGGGIWNSGTMEIASSTVDHNAVTNGGGGRGGGLFTYDPAFTSVHYGSFTGNTSDYRGGGTYNDGVQAWVGVTLDGNSAVEGGGGMAAFNGAGHNSTLTSLVFRHNTAGSSTTQGVGAGLSIDNPGTVINTTFNQNAAVGPTGTPGWGGGVYGNDESVFLHDTFTSNTAGNGAGMYDSDPSGDFIPIRYSTFSNNHATGDGGGIYEGDTNLTPMLTDILLSHTTITGNTADHDGGGVWVAAYPLVFITDGSSVANNAAGHACPNVSPC